MVVLRSRVLAVSFVALSTFSVGLFAQDQKRDKKLEEAQKKEIQAVVKVVDDVMAGQPVPDDLSATWARQDFLKAQGNRQYVPFVVTIDPSKVSTPNVAIYWRVIAQAGTTPAPAGVKADEKKDKVAAFAYQDAGFSPVVAGQNPMSLNRSFTVGAGTYDVYVVVKEPVVDKKNAPAPKMSVIKQVVTVPDFWNAELNMSSVILAQKIDPLPAPLTPQQLVDRPYAMGVLEIVPRLHTNLTKKDELSTFLLVYNPQIDSAKKPDVTVEYSFYVKAAGGEKFFNRTSPQSLNAKTLPEQFDLAAGHQLQTGQAVRLASFPEGEYRLEIKVTDKIAGKSLTRDVNFTVSGS